MKCDVCGCEKIIEGDRYCSDCGSEIVYPKISTMDAGRANMKFCPRCGSKILNPNSSFCSGCGFKLSSNRSGDSPSISGVFEEIASSGEVLEETAFKQAISDSMFSAPVSNPVNPVNNNQASIDINSVIKVGLNIFALYIAIMSIWGIKAGIINAVEEKSGNYALIMFLLVLNAVLLVRYGSYKITGWAYAVLSVPLIVQYLALSNKKVWEFFSYALEGSGVSYLDAMADDVKGYLLFSIIVVAVSSLVLIFRKQLFKNYSGSFIVEKVKARGFEEQSDAAVYSLQDFFYSGSRLKIITIAGLALSMGIIVIFNIWILVRFQQYKTLFAGAFPYNMGNLLGHLSLLAIFIFYLLLFINYFNRSLRLELVVVAGIVGYSIRFASLVLSNTWLLNSTARYLTSAAAGELIFKTLIPALIRTLIFGAFVLYFSKIYGSGRMVNPEKLTKVFGFLFIGIIYIYAPYLINLITGKAVPRYDFTFQYFYNPAIIVNNLCYILFYYSINRYSVKRMVNWLL